MHEATVLLIDDDQSVHTALDDFAHILLVDILHALSPEEGIRLAMTKAPDLILLDLNMPRMDGLKVCSHLKETASTRHIPILFLTVDRNVHHLAKALEFGADDYILKPFNAVELKARVRVALRTAKVFELLKEQARVDGLTGLKNRAAMDDALIAAIAAQQRTGQPFAVLMLDLDHFKEINDGFGHGVGDEVLQTVGTVVRNTCRPYDTACRYGGDEFGIVLGHVEGPEAALASQRLLATLHEVSLPTEAGWIHVRCSAGLAASTDMPIEFEAADILKAADAALYEAKKNGRAQLALASALAS